MICVYPCSSVAREHDFKPLMERIEMSEPTTSSRRDFLKTSAIVAGAALTANVVAERMAHAAGSDQMKIGIIGTGGRGSGAVAQALNTSNSVSLVAAADAFEDNVRSKV